jgi:hypothetical protein
MTETTTAPTSDRPVNDITRELGGAFDVAIVGTILSSRYGTRLDSGIPDDVPAPVAATERESLGAAVQAPGALNTNIVDAAREAFVYAMSRASITHRGGHRADAMTDQFTRTTPRLEPRDEHSRN